MRALLTAREMKKCDENTTEHFGMPSCVLMERAALRFVPVSTVDQVFAEVLVPVMTKDEPVREAAKEEPAMAAFAPVTREPASQDAGLRQ